MMEKPVAMIPQLEASGNIVDSQGSTDDFGGL
jgi:hypothetical protein